jgi:hypothetical protein
LNNGGIILASITVKVGSSASNPVINTIQISGLNPDPKLSNNSFTVKTSLSK